MKVAYTRGARQQIAEIHDYIAQDKSRAATAAVERIRSAIERLAFFPELGRPGQVPGTRELLISGLPYVAVYVVDDRVIRIIAVVHGVRRR